MSEHKKVVLFGAGKVGRRCFYNLIKKFDIVAVIDNNKELIGKKFEKNIPIIGLDDYVKKYRNCEILITLMKDEEVKEQLEQIGIHNYHVPSDVFACEDVPTDEIINHDNWRKYLQEHFNVEGMEILEVGSRNVVGGVTRDLFSKANYTGFDYYDGENVDVVGDAHELSKYFDKRFDLIFSSAVFEHLAMPWKVSTEIIKLLKPGGYVFIETHYSYISHERPWHFFQFSENAIDLLFPEKFGMKCLRKGCCNLVEGYFSKDYASEYLKGRAVNGLYCHAEYLGQKQIDVDNLSWDSICLKDVVGATKYPYPSK